MSNRRERRTYSKEFKQQMVDLYQSGKPRLEIIREYELTPSAFDNWLRQANSSGSFAEKELKALRKQLKQLEMENDILKQAALIFGRKDK